MSTVNFPFEALSRNPDTEAQNLFAFDATDRLLIDTAGEAIKAAPDGTVVIIGDRYGALTLASGHLGARNIRVHQDSYTSVLALAQNYRRLADALELPGALYEEIDLDSALVRGARVVLIQLPRDLRQLDTWARLIASHADPDVQVFAGGRVKHMTRAMNEVLGHYFGSVTASLARQKSRVLSATNPRGDLGSPGEGEGLTKTYDRDLDLWVASYPGAFADGKVDIGARFFIPFLEDEANLPEPSTSGSTPLAVDLGCGTGLLAVALTRAHPHLRVIATDRSAAAVASTKQSALLNLSSDQLDRLQVKRDHGLSEQPDSSVDLIVCNPPFHTESTVSSAASDLLFDEAARVLRPGGVLLTVYNSHLHHRHTLERVVGPTTQLGRNQKFTVTRSIRSEVAAETL